MKVLVTGANGFIGSSIVSHLLASGMEVTCCVRNPEQIAEQFSSCHFIQCDFVNDTLPDIWMPRLQGIDVVINCVGVLNQKKEMIQIIQYETPVALFKACREVGVKKLIQISALGIEDQPNNPFATSKLAVDNFLLNLPVNATVIRPSLVYGEGSYGGTSLFRALSALPGIIPLIGNGYQKFQPIHIDDLSKTVISIIKQNINGVINAVGPEEVTMRNLFTKLRSWLGYKKAKYISVSLRLVRLSAKFCDYFSSGPINSNSLTMLTHDNTADYNQFKNTIGIEARSFSTALQSTTSHVQDRWHAKLYFVRPLLRFVIAMIWILLGIIPITSGYTQSLELLNNMQLTGSAGIHMLYFLSALDILIGVLTLCRWKIFRLGILQLIILFCYLVGTSFYMPSAWLDPLAPMLKVIPFMFTIVIMMILEEQR